MNIYKKAIIVKIPNSVLISRIDSIGDVVLALPVAGMIKKIFPGTAVAILGKEYTRPIADACEHVDAFIELDDFVKKEITINGRLPGAILHLVTNSGVAKRAKDLKIPVRVGTMSRLHHWFYCNKLIWLSRRNAGLHEAQSNLKLLKPFGIKRTATFEEISGLYGLTRFPPLSDEFKKIIRANKCNVILHPKSRGNAREWPVSHFINLINSLDPHLYEIFLTGVESEKIYLEQIANAVNRPVINMAGKISLPQLISFIASVDAVVSNSTGPVHVAAALGTNTIGIYPSLRHKNPVRWAPIGLRAKAITFKDECLACKNTPGECSCMQAIEPAEIKALLDKIAGSMSLK